jgi:hypothetical protein
VNSFLSQRTALHLKKAYLIYIILVRNGKIFVFVLYNVCMYVYFKLLKFAYYNILFKYNVKLKDVISNKFHYFNKPHSCICCHSVNRIQIYSLKLINNTEFNSVGIKSLSGSCDLKTQDGAGCIIIISIEEGSYRFFADLYAINCSDKNPEEIKPKDQGFDEATEKIVNRTSDNSNNGLNLDKLSFKDLFNSKYKSIMWTTIIIITIIIFIIILFIICYCYCNRTKVAVTAATGPTN